jgi:hypothetical protein
MHKQAGDRQNKTALLSPALSSLEGRRGSASWPLLLVSVQMRLIEIL